MSNIESMCKAFFVIGVVCFIAASLITIIPILLRNGLGVTALCVAIGLLPIFIFKVKEQQNDTNKQN